MVSEQLKVRTVAGISLSQFRYKSHKKHWHRPYQ